MLTNIQKTAQDMHDEIDGLFLNDDPEDTLEPAIKKGAKKIIKLVKSCDSNKKTTSSKPKTLTIFRKYPDGGVIALFPPTTDDELLDYRRRGFVGSYMALGQHGDATYGGTISSTKAATETEYAPLLKELKSLGYNPDIKKKWIRK